jgi:hypothetical protein
MVIDGGRRANARWWGLIRSVAGVAGLALATLLGGCTTDARHQTRGATVAFESIDGPPRAVFDQLVTRLDAEARARQVAVVSRRGPARYRVRLYLAANVERKRTAIAWVMDIYDSDLRRAARIAGEQPAGRSRPDAWAAADGAVLARIVEAGMAQLAEFTSETRPTAPEPEKADPAPDNPPAVPAAGHIRVAGVSAAAAGLGGRAR